MIIQYDTHYDEAYWTGQKTYRGPDGVTKLYTGPSLAWEGFQPIVDALVPLLPGKTLLDIGCGGGDLAGRFLKKGYDAYGVDISEYAVTHCVPEMKGRLTVADITREMDSFLLRPFDVVLATDLLEHIYEEDLDRTFDWILSVSKRWLFFCIGITFDHDELVLKKSAPIPWQREETAIAGHVNVRNWRYWARLFQRKGLTIRWDLMYVFQMARERNQAWRETWGWNMQATWITEKVRP